MVTGRIDYIFEDNETWLDGLGASVIPDLTTYGDFLCRYWSFKDSAHTN